MLDLKHFESVQLYFFNSSKIGFLSDGTSHTFQKLVSRGAELKKEKLLPTA